MGRPRVLRRRRCRCRRRRRRPGPAHEGGTCHDIVLHRVDGVCGCVHVRPSPFAVRNGHIKRITDADIQSSVLEIAGVNVSTTYITCPVDPKKTLGIKLPFLVMIIKNLKKYFTFEVTVLDDKNVHRRFRASNYQVRARVHGLVQTGRVSKRSLRWSARSVVRSDSCAVHHTREAVHLHHAHALG
ncbi:DUF667 domain-containing protein [archaeon]|nr:MAG: DUF667 domain-containing protein [archaeon]